MDARMLARGLASLRIGIGISLFSAPATAAKLWLGGEPDGRTTLLTRLVGARDLVVGVGQLVTLDAGGNTQNWIDAGIACDAADVSAAVMGRRQLSMRAKLTTLAAAASGVAAGVYVKQQLLLDQDG